MNAAGAEPSRAPADANDSNHPGAGCPLITIERLDGSAWGYDTPGFSGADLVIRDPEAWRTFWKAHSLGGTEPPRVNFHEHVVIAAILGVQNSGCGPNITILGIRYDGGLHRIAVLDDERPGPCDFITNPYHIVKVPRECLPAGASIVFDHRRPAPDAGTVWGYVYSDRPDFDAPQPLPGALVTITPSNSDTPRKTITGPDGSYLFVDVPPGDYVGRAEHPANEPAEAMIHLPPGGHVRQDFIVKLKMLEYGQICGQVFGEQPGSDPVPLPGAVLELVGPNGGAARTEADADGRYFIDHVQPGMYKLICSHPGYVPGLEFLMVMAGDKLERNFYLPAHRPDKGLLCGHVYALAPAGVFPLPGAMLALFRDNAHVAKVTSANNGAYAFDPLPAGDYLLKCFKDGFAGQQVGIVIVAGAKTEQDFSLRPLPPPPGTFRGLVVGRVGDNHEEPLGGALVRLIRDDAELRRAETNARGEFVMEGLPPGPYRAVASKPGWKPADAPIEILSGETTKFRFVLLPP